MTTFTIAPKQLEDGTFRAGGTYTINHEIRDQHTSGLAYWDGQQELRRTWCASCQQYRWFSVYSCLVCNHR